MGFSELIGEGAGAEDFDFLIFDFDKGGRWVVDSAGVFDVGNMLEHFRRKLTRVSNRRFAGEISAGGNEGMADCADDFEKFGMVGDTNADEWATAGNFVGDFRVFRQENGEWSWKISLDNSLFECSEVFGICTEHVEVAHQEEQRLVLVAMFGDFDLLNGGGAQGVSEDAVNRVGRRDDEIALTEFVGDAGGVHKAIFVPYLVVRVWLLLLRPFFRQRFRMYSIFL